MDNQIRRIRKKYFFIFYSCYLLTISVFDAQLQLFEKMSSLRTRFRFLDILFHEKHTRGYDGMQNAQKQLNTGYEVFKL